MNKEKNMSMKMSLLKQFEKETGINPETYDPHGDKESGFFSRALFEKYCEWLETKIIKNTLESVKVWRISKDGEYGAVQFSYGNSQGGANNMKDALYQASLFCPHIEVLPEGASVGINERSI